MKAGAATLALLWFAASTYAGYRLTEHSFSWIGQASAPPSGTVVEGRVEEDRPVDLEKLKGMSREELQEAAKSLTPQQLLCLRASIAPARVSAVIAGDITPQEEAAAKKCLE